MATDPMTSEPLAAFDPAVAAAVVTVLRANGVAATGAADAGDGDVLVRVPPGLRDEAFAIVAEHMETVRDLAAGERDDGPPAGAAVATEDEERPVLVFDVLRRYGVLLVLVLAPLLVITLSQPTLPLGVALVVLVGGAAAIVWWRERDAG